MNREEILEALLTRLQTIPGVGTVSRELLIYSDAAPQPAIFLVDVDEQYPDRPTGLPPLVVIQEEVWIYATTDLPVPMASEINRLLDALEAAIAPDVVFNGTHLQNAQTLGGLVLDCRIEGVIDKSFGHKLRQAVAIVPLKIYVPQ